MKKIFLALLIMPCLIFANDVADDDDEEKEFNPVRTLSNPDKSASFEATITKYDGEKVTFIRKGKTAASTIEVSKFSDEDKEWLDENKDEINASKADDDSKASPSSKVGSELAPLARKLNKSSLQKTKNFNSSAKYYIVLYSASWCPPCRKEMPNVVKLYNEKIAEDKMIELVHTSCDDDKKAAANWAKENEVTFPVIYKNDIKKSKVLEANAPSGIPSAVLIEAKTGKVIAKGLPEGLYTKYKAL